MFAWIGGIILFLLLIVYIVLSVPAVQTFIAGKITSSISSKTHTIVRIDRVALRFPTSLVLKEIYFEDQKKDTLLYGHELAVNIAMWGLLKHKIDISSVDLDKLTAHISRNDRDSTFNFNFIIEAMSGPHKAKPEAPKDSSAPWEISLGGLTLKDIYLTYNDSVSGMNINGNVGSFKIDLDKFDLTHKAFHINDVNLENSAVTFLQFKETATTDTTTSAAPDISFKNINISQVKFNYDNSVTGKLMAYEFGKTILSADEINLPQQIVKLKEVNLDKCKIQLTAAKLDSNTVKPDAVKKIEAKNGGNQKWLVTVERIKFNNNSFKMDDENAPQVANAMDFKHLFFSEMNVDIKNLLYTTNTIKGIVNNISLNEQCGFKLRHFETSFTYDSTQAELADLDLQTSKTHLGNYLKISAASLSQISKQLGDAKLNVKLNKSVIDLRDVLYFNPGLIKQPPFAGNPDRIINLQADVEGEIKNLSIKQFVFSTGANTQAEIIGTIKGLPDAKSTSYDLAITKMNTTAHDLKNLLRPVKLPDSINIPAGINMTGYFKGSMSDFNSKLGVKTTAGNIDALAAMRQGSDNIPHYKVNIKIAAVDLGYILGDTSMGKISLQTEVTGQGFKPEQLNADVDLKLLSADVKGYVYHDLAAKGNLKNKRYTGTVLMNDSNLQFSFDGFIDMLEGHQAYKFDLDLKGADLRALHLQEEEFRVSAKMNVDLKGSTVNDLNGTASINNVLIIKKGTSYPIEKFLFASINEKGKTEMSLESSVLSAKFSGTIAIGDLGNEIKDFTANYFSSGKKSPVPTHPQQFTFNIEVHNSAVLSDIFLPQLTSYTPGPITGSYNSENDQLQLSVDIPQITYSGNRIDSLRLNVNSDRQKINYAMALSRLSGGSINLDLTQLSGSVENNTVDVNLDVKGNKKQKLLLGAQLKTENKLMRFALKQKLIFNDTAWNVPSENYIEFGDKHLVINHLELSNRSQQLSVNSRSDKGNAPIDISFKNFEISTLSKIVEHDSSIFDGQINGKATLENIFDKMRFTSDLAIKNFSYKSDTLGDIAIKANNTGADRYDVKVDVTGNGNQLNVSGFYKPEGTDNLNFDISLKSLNIASVQSFTNGQINRASGTVSGNFKITGASGDPQINGDLNFKNVAFNSAFTNTYLKLNNERIVITPTGISFPSFTLRDSLNNTATISGKVDMQDKKNILLNVDLNTDKFLALNSTEKDNELFYGKIILSSLVKLRGTSQLPTVDVKATLVDSSNFTVAIPKEKYTTDKGEGVVEFIDPTQKISPIMTRKDTTPVKAQIKGLDITSDLTVTKSSTLRVLVDPITGDSLIVKGDAALSFSMDPSGKMSLAGNYTISEGSYRVSFNSLIHKNFEIQNGSTINWNGDVMDADVSIDAIYNISTSPIDLVADQISGMSSQEQTTYKQKLPFQVFLHMRGQLLKPEISFEISMPQEDRGALGGTVFAKLQLLNQEESELNKQVFALLVLNRFIQQDPLASSGGGGAESVARESVSKFLSSQLNKMSDQFIKGVELNFDVQSYDDYSTGAQQGRTQLNIGVKKQVNERLSVQVGSSVDLEGERARANNASDIAGDVTVEYRLTDDGRYRLKAFRQNQYEGVFEGELIETGAGIIFVRDYDDWKELFRKPKDATDEN